MNRTTAFMFVAVSLTWAASCKTVDPYIATGETLNTVGQEFVVVASAMNRGLDEHVISTVDYKRWAEFAHRFKTSYSLAVAMWTFAVDHKDDIQKGKATDIILALSAELATFTPLVVNLVHPMPPVVAPAPSGGSL